MDSVLRGAATYVLVFLIFRLSGKRSLAQITTFDAVLLLIISETTQSALANNNNSFTNTILLILTIVGIDIGLSHIKRWFPGVEKVMDGAPIIIFDGKEMRQDVLKNERVAPEDILHSARATLGLANMGGCSMRSWNLREISQTCRNGNEGTRCSMPGPRPFVARC